MVNITTHAFQNVSWENVSTFSGFLANANQSAGGGLFAGIDILVFFVLLISIASTVGSWEVGALASGFITLILSVLFVYMGVLSMTFAGVFVGLIIALIMYMMWNRND